MNHHKESGNNSLSPSVRRVNLPSCAKSENFSMHITLFTWKTNFQQEKKSRGRWEESQSIRNCNSKMFSFLKKSKKLCRKHGKNVLSLLTAYSKQCVNHPNRKNAEFLWAENRKDAAVIQECQNKNKTGVISLTVRKPGYFMNNSHVPELYQNFFYQTCSSGKHHLQD